MDRCQKCKLGKTAKNCQECYQAEYKRRVAVEKKYIATLAIIDKFYIEANRIMKGIQK